MYGGIIVKEIGRIDLIKINYVINFLDYQIYRCNNLIQTNQNL